MVEELIREDNPDYDRLDRMSAEYFIALRKSTRLYSYFLFILPLVIIILGLDFFENLLALAVSIWLYTAFILASVHATYRAEKRYRRLDCSFPYYLVHSDASLGTLRVSGIIMVVLFFVYIQTLHLTYQFQLFIITVGMIVVFLFLNVFSPRFSRYSRISRKPDPEIMEKMREIEANLKMPEYIIHVVPEEKLKVANAYCTGLIVNRIFVTDYLLENLKPDEAVCILSHELGHVYYRHNFKSMILVFGLLFVSALLFFSFLFVSNVLVANVLSIAGIAMFIVGVPVVVPAVRRNFELQADLFASRYVDEATAMSALKKTNYLNMVPAAFSGGMTHPSLPLRLQNIQSHFQQRY